MKEISDRLKIGIMTLCRKMKTFGFEIRGVKEQTQNPITREKYKKTCLKKFGVEHNLQKDSPCRKKMIENLIKNYGVENVFQLDCVKDKIKNYITEKLNNENYQDNFPRGKKVFSSIHKKIVSFLNENGVENKIEFVIKIPNDKIMFNKTYYSYDILIKETSKLIEVNGDYWHANPEKYNQNDLIVGYYGETRSAGYIWERDEEKIEFAKANGFKVLILWENEINNNFGSIKEKIQNYLEEK